MSLNQSFYLIKYMKILVINIALRPDSNKVMFPIGLGYVVTAMERAGFNFDIYDLDALRPTDEQIDEYIKNKDFDVVAMGCMVTGYKHVKKLTEIIKKYKKDSIIIVGNSVANSIPEILMKYTKADIGVMSEGDITIVELLRAIEEEKPLEDVKGIFFKKEDEVFFTPKREAIHDLNSLPRINYDLFDMKTYLAKCKYNVTEPYPIPFEDIIELPINTARGCLFNCSFCYHVFKDKRYRVRSIENIAEEIKLLKEKYGLNYVQFSDELTLFSREQAHKFADGLLAANIKIYWQACCRAGLFKEQDLDLALKLKKAGCVELEYSLESGDPEILRAMNKMISIEDFTIQTKILKQAGITVSTSIVIGYPQETEESLKRTFDVCYDSDVYPSAGYLLPQPGTIIYDYAKAIGKIPDEEDYVLKIGDRQDFTLNLTGMPQEELERLVRMNLKRIADKLNLGLSEDKLVKTGHHIQKKGVEKQ